MTTALSTHEVPVAWAGPFGCSARIVHMRDGQTVHELVETAIREHKLSPRFREHGFVRISDVDVPREAWQRVRPRVRRDLEIVVTFHLPMHGGGGGLSGGSSGGGSGGKNPFAMIALIAVLVVATAISAGALGPAGLEIFGSAFAAGGIGATGTAGAVLIGGQLAIAALTPAPKLPDAPAASTPLTDAAGNAASLTGNVLVPGAPIPRVIGTRRVFPQLLCRPLVDQIGDNQYIEVVMGLAGPHAMSVPRAGDVDISNILEAVVELQDGLPGSPKQTLVSRYGFTLTPNVELVGHIIDPTSQQQLLSTTDPDSNSPQWFTFVSRPAPDEIWLTLAWPEGLTYDDGTNTTINQAIRCRFRRRGDVTWINCPELHVSMNSPTAFSRTIRFVWGTKPVAPALPPTDKGWIFAYADVPAQGAGVLPAGTDFHAATYFGSTGGAGAVTLLQQSNVATSAVLNTELKQDRAVFYLDAATYAQDAVYEIQVMRSAPYFRANLTQTTYVSAAGIYDFFKYYISGAVYFIQINAAKVHQRVILSSVASVINENPIQCDNIATLSLRVHSRALEQVSVLASGYTYDWDGSGWNTLTTTSNPAPHYRDVQVGNLNSDPLPPDLIDNADLVAWRTNCIAKSYTADMVVDGRNAADVLTAIAAAGYARPRQSELWGVLMDKDRSADSPAQIFSARNLQGFGFNRPFTKRPTGFRVRYDDSTDDYKEAEEIVLDPLDPTADESRLEDIRYDAIVDTTKAIARAKFDLKQADLRFTFYHGTADCEAIVCRRGDLVGVQHDVISQRAGFARVKTVRTSAGNVTGLLLDGSIPLVSEDAWSNTASAWSAYSSAWVTPRSGVAIRLLDGTVITKEVTGDADDTLTVNFVTPFAVPSGSTLAATCLLTSGKLTQEYSRMLVFDIAPQQDLTAQLTFVPEAPELWQ